MTSSRGSSRPRDRTCISCIDRWILYHGATREALSSLQFPSNLHPDLSLVTMFSSLDFIPFRHYSLPNPENLCINQSTDKMWAIFCFASLHVHLWTHSDDDVIVGRCCTGWTPRGCRRVYRGDKEMNFCNLCTCRYCSFIPVVCSHRSSAYLWFPETQGCIESQGG